MVDDFKREALGIEIDLRMPAKIVVRVLDRTVANWGHPLNRRMDNVPELLSVMLAPWAEERRIMQEFVKRGKPTQNAFIERFNRMYHTANLLRTLNESREITQRWLNEYNSERPHEYLNNLPPEEYQLMAAPP